MTNSRVLKASYKNYRKKNKGQKGALSFLRSFMPEMIFRTTKLEGEPVTRRMVRAIFGWKSHQLNLKVLLLTKKLPWVRGGEKVVEPRHSKFSLIWLTGMTAENLKTQAREFFSKHRFVKCPAFPKEKVAFNSKGLSHLFYQGSRKVSSRPSRETQARVSLLPRALEILKVMPLAQEESLHNVGGKRVKYWAFEAVVRERRVKVIVRQIGNGQKHFWSIIPAWRRARGKVINARGNLSRQ